MSPPLEFPWLPLEWESPRAAVAAVRDRRQEAVLGLSKATVSATAGVPTCLLPNVIAIVQMGIRPVDRLHGVHICNRVVVDVPIVVAISAVAGLRVTRIRVVEMNRVGYLWNRH